MTALPLRDFTAVEQTHLDAIEAAPAAEEAVRRRLAIELWNEGAWCGECDHSDWEECRMCQEDTMRYADAAIAVLSGPSSDAEQAVERSQALADEWGEYPASPEAARARELRAALAGD